MRDDNLDKACYIFQTMEYLTREKKEELEMELKELITVRRREIAEALEYAKSLGDLSENAEYQQAREDQATTEERIAHLEQILKNAVVMDKHHSGSVEVGSTVTVLKKGKSDEKVFTIVGSEEANSIEGRISNESPLGKALMGKRAGDSVTAHTPKGEMEYTIKKIA